MWDTTNHEWAVPPIPATAPDTTTVVIQSRCGQYRSIPAWQVAEVTKPDADCTDCEREHALDAGERDVA